MDHGGNFIIKKKQDHSYSKHPVTLDINRNSYERQCRRNSEESDSPALTPLDKTHDNFETLLLKLLQAYTMQSSDTNPGISTSSSGGQRGTSISGDALETLSPEQMSALVTSNSVNYEVIQQILAQQPRSGVSAPGVSHSEMQQSLHQEEDSRFVREPLGSSGLSSAKPYLKWVDPTPMQMCSSSDVLQGGMSEGPSTMSLQRDPNTSSSSASGLSSPLGPSSPVVISSGGGSGANTPPVIQITMDQLAVLQSHVNGLLQAQNVAIPSEVSPDIIQSLILRQLEGTANVLLKENGPPSSSSPCPVANASTGATAPSSFVSESASRSTVGGVASSVGPSTGFTGNVAVSSSSDSITDSGLGSSGNLMGGSVPGEASSPRSPMETQTEADPSGRLEVKREPPRDVASFAKKPAGEVSHQGSGSQLRGRGTTGRGLKRGHSSRPMTLSGAAISAVQANKRAVPIKGRPRGRGRGMSRGASRGRRTSDSSGSYEQQKEFVSTPQDLRSPTNFDIPTPFDIFRREVLPTIPSANTDFIVLMWNAMGDDVKKRYYDEHEILRLQARKAREEEEQQKQLEQGRTAIRERTMALSVAMSCPPVMESPKITVQESVVASSLEDVPDPEVIEKVDLEPIHQTKEDGMCICIGCENLAIYSEDRGSRYCSNECVADHCRRTFELFVSRKLIHC